ncbi:bifunctional 2-methylcitrate synthase/citrate synthase [Trebonia kvetii]|uniref:citrate synthase (unknown stereospecificity) n=2 Tax=Trebonia kvetii TaxID=2480626 RepID=A0A6P2BUM3_9ACTN|nr:bifunctional 2-methylcitrate synthase/citrate synthase [Trebonia kvetii]
MSRQNSSLTYRGYPVQALCRRHSFEEVAYLLWHGELPDGGQLSAQNRAERSQRALGPHLAAMLAAQPLSVPPADALLTVVVSRLGGDGPAERGIAPGAVHAQALRLFAVLPSIVAFDQRRRHGLDAVAPRDDLGYAANFLYMTFGRVPEPQIVSVFERSLILYAGQGLSAATSGPRVGVSPLSRLHGAVTAAISALKEAPGDGSPEAVTEMLKEIAIPDNARPWLEKALAEGRTIAGFSPQVSGSDARVPAMRAALGMVAALRDHEGLIVIYEALATAVQEMTDLRPSLDYPAAAAYHLIGFDRQTITPILAAAGLPGWTAHLTDHVAASAITRPRLAYDGHAKHHLAGGR